MRADTHRFSLGSLLLLLLWLTPGPGLAGGFNGAMSGSWWNPERGGEGQFISFEQVGPRLVVILAYFTYDEQGQAHWMVGTADFDASADQIEVPMLKAHGPRFGVQFRAEDVELSDAGTVLLRYLDCDRIGFGFSNATEVLDFEISRLIGPVDGADCAHPHALPNAEFLTGRHTGAWWDPARGGEGQFMSLETLGDRHILMFYYFTYDEHGRADWMVGHADFEPDQKRVQVPLVTGSGARFGSAFDAADVVLSPSGFVSLEATACNAFRLRYNGKLNFGLNLERLGGDLIDAPCTLADPVPGELDLAIKALVDEHGLSGDPSIGRELPGIDDGLARLGKLLFFSKSLSAELDTACASCHHPSLAGADALAVSVGAGALDPDLLGRGRRMADGSVIMHRNANTFFNTGLFDRGLFWDSRIESLAAEAGFNGAAGEIRTPDSLLGQPDSRAGPNLLAAQARFPVVEPAEMRGAGLPGLSDDQLRNHLAERIGNYGAGLGALPASDWLAEFQAAFDSDAEAEALINFDNIALALGEYQRSAVFVESPWSHYVRGDYDAISVDAKQGALLFFRDVDQGGLHCVRCHSGDLFTDELHHVVGFPQIGPGFGDPNNDDFGRERETGLTSDRHHFRTPSLLNVELTAPYGHSGIYRSLLLVVAHYINTRGTAIGQLSLRSWCQDPPFDSQPDCGDDFQSVLANSNAALDSLAAARLANPDSAMPNIPVPPNFAEQLDQVVAFLNSLTDPCLLDRDCFGRWIPESDQAPDQLQLDAIDRDGNPL